MVFQTLIQMVRSRGPDELWRKRKIFKLSAHYVGRRRNCYSIAIRNVHRSLQYVTKGRKLKKDDARQLWETRISAGAEQFGLEGFAFRKGLERNEIQLNRKSLADLAAWEPRTFEALVMAARERAAIDGYTGLHEHKADNKTVFHNEEEKNKKIILN